MSPYVSRYPGPRWSILYGAFDGVEKFALEDLQREVQNFLPYVVEVLPAGEVDPATREQVILLGTPENNPLVAQLVEQGKVQLPGHDQGFAALGGPSPWNPEAKAVVLAGRRAAGVLYAVETFNSQVLGQLLPGGDQAVENLRAKLDTLPDFALNEAPRIEERGIWTWGYVIYDYRRFLDNMARLRMNLLTIWNDTPPLNAGDVIAYAHERGIKVNLGFPWGWGKDYNLGIVAHRQAIEEEVVRHFAEKIAPVGPDGIYFQTLTEHNETEIEGQSTAGLACQLVNRIAMRLFELAPGLNIQFGLHATSIQESYGKFRQLDPRVTIVWEDAGAVPYTYTPALRGFGRNAEETLAYSLALAAIRPGAVFGMVPKGWTCLDWPNEFEHHKDYLLGLRSPVFIQRRMGKLRTRWQAVNRLWQRHAPRAAHFYQEMVKATGGRMQVTGLVEDGLLEEKIQPSVDLFARMLWNPFDLGNH